MLNKNLQTLSESQFRSLQQINEEFEKGMLTLNSLGSHTVTFYGGAKLKPEEKTYQDILKIASTFAKNGWGVVSGGGPGVMAAALEGAKQGGGEAIAFSINLGDEPDNLHSDTRVLFQEFAARKYMLRQSDVLVYAPGGLGTLDELMENLTLMKTHKYPQKPLFLYDSSFWKGCIDWLNQIVSEYHLIDQNMLHSLYKIVDSPEELLQELFDGEG